MTHMWVTEDELVALSGVPAHVLRRGIRSGLFDGLVREIDGVAHFAPDVAPLCAWSDALGDDVVEGYLTPEEAKTLLWQRARQLRHRTAQLDQRLSQRLKQHA